MACWTGLQRTRILCGLPWKPSATSPSSDWFYATGHHRVTGERPEESSRGAEIGKFVTGYVLWLPAVRQPPDVDRHPPRLCRNGTFKLRESRRQNSYE